MSDPTTPPRHEARAAAHPQPVSRRRFLERSAMAVAGGVLFSCTGGKVLPRLEPTATTIDTRWPIKRVLYVMMENRSFDNLFGRFPGVNGTTTGVKWGEEVDLLRCLDWLPGDLPHDRAAALSCLNGGKMDGFAGGKYGDPWSYSQFQEEQLPNYWLWAREYGLSDNFFASALGPSYPNHFFFVAGQSGGIIDNPENIQTQVKDGGAYRFKSWGCDALGDDVFVLVKDGDGNLTKHDTCFRFKTVGEQLTEAGVDWRYYSAPPGGVGYFWNAYNGIDGVFHTDLWQEHAAFSVDRLFDDIAANDLPAVTWVTPYFALSDHPPASSSFAHNWLTDLVNGVMDSDLWEHTAIFITWDEWGGFYDSVPPPEIDEVGLGFRVPLLTISPYARRGVIDDELGEFSTPLRFIADNWGLDYLTPRIANTHNFEHVFDFSKTPRPPVIATARAKTYGDAFEYPDDYPAWPASPAPAEDPF